MIWFLVSTGTTWSRGVDMPQNLEPAERYWEEFKVIFWWTGAANVALLILLAATSRWWLFTPNPDKAEAPPTWNRPGLWAWILAAAIMLLALGLRVPRLDNSLYNDEAYCYQRHLSGTWKNNELKSEPLRFRRTPWDETWFRNESGNNSQIFSVLARSCLEKWKEWGWAEKGTVAEVPVRLPPLAAGVLTLGLLGLLGWRWRGTQGMLWAMLASALHGWMVRFQSEARGYSLMLLGVALIYLGLDYALRQGRWRDWMLFGAGVLLCAWAFLGAVYFLVALFAVVVVLQVARWKQAQVDAHQIVRPLIAGAIAAMIGSQLLSSYIPQILRQLATFHSIKGEMSGAWWTLIGSYHALGAHWQDYDSENPNNFAWLRLLEQHPALSVLIGGFAAVIIGGMVAMIRQRRAAMVTVAATLLSLLLGWAIMSRKGNYMLPWYTLYSTPGFILAAAWGLANLSTAVQQRLRNKAGALIGTLAALILLTPLALGGVHWSKHTKQDERAVVVHLRGNIYPAYLGTPGERPLLVSFWSNIPAYDPHAAILVKEEHLDTMIQRARTEDRPLYVAFSHRGHALREHPTILKRIENSPDFKHVFTSPGQEEEQFTAYVYQWVGQ